MSDTDATQTRQDVVANVDEIIEHVINANMLNMPYDVYSELFDAVDGLGVEIENLQAENAKLRELVRDIMHQCNDGNPRCDECIGRNDGECVALLRMRELGVEVGP